MEILFKRKGYTANFSMSRVNGNNFLLRDGSLHHYSYCTGLYVRKCIDKLGCYPKQVHLRDHNVTCSLFFLLSSMYSKLIKQ